jgi:hypothetical protein
MKRKSVSIVGTRPIGAPLRQEAVAGAELNKVVAGEGLHRSLTVSIPGSSPAAGGV